MTEHEDVMRHLLVRLFPIIVLVIVASIGHRVMTSYHQHALGSILFIVLVVGGMFMYYQRLFRDKSISNVEFLISMLFIFIVTVSMFAMIYSTHSENENDGFIYLGNRANLEFTDALYFSTTTITTLGMGDITPLGIYRYYVMAEVVLGLVFFGVVVFYITQIMQRETEAIESKESEIIKKESEIMRRLKSIKKK